MDNMGIVIIAVAALGAAGFFLPYLFGDSYYFAKWRLVFVVFLVGLVWILLTPHGCQFPG